MRGAVRLGALFVAALTLGCATRVNISYDPAEDFSSYRTWDWIPRGRNVYALPGSEGPLEARTSELLAQALRERGLVRVSGGADLLVGYELRVRRQLVAVNETGAHEFVSSHHASPSYLVQSTHSRIDVYDKASLWVVVTDGQRERRLWRGELTARRSGPIDPHLDGLVSRLLEGFPAGKAISAPPPDDDR